MAGRSWAPLVALCALALAGSARGSVVERLALPDLVGRADAIALGTVVRVETAWSADHRHLLRWVEVKVEEPLKGTPGPVLLLRLRGGSRDGLSEVVIGEPEFTTGERGLFFVRQLGSQHALVGMGQGVFVLDSAGQARQRVEGLALAGPDRRGQLVLAEPEVAAVSLADLRAAVVQQLGGGR